MTESCSSSSDSIAWMNGVNVEVIEIPRIVVRMDVKALIDLFRALYMTHAKSGARD